MYKRSVAYIIFVLFGFNFLPVFSVVNEAHGLNPARSKAVQAVRKRALSRSVRITGVLAYDKGSLSSPDATLDTLQEVCSNSDDEPFFDTLFGITLQNNGSIPVRIRKVAYVVFAANSDGSRFRARKYSPVGRNEIAAQSAGEIYALFLDTDGNRKYFAGASVPIAVDLGFRTVKVRVIGIDFMRRRFRIKQRVTFSFGNPDRCS